MTAWLAADQPPTGQLAPGAPRIGEEPAVPFTAAILNALWAGEQVDAGRMRRILALFRMEFAEPGEMRRDIAGRSVYLALAADGDDVVKMKPQNLILNLPLKASE